ncbi:MAG: dTDP-4-dehydrorhamnose reductase [Deltaproteobacteria bacterium]|nr:dTDP-4-dehydrorhamnose reductase [Deltaproteobacteria bacterium]
MSSPGILLLGGDGQLGRELGGSLPSLGNLVVLTRNDVDLESPNLESQLEERLPPSLKIIVNAAAYTKVDLAQTQKTQSHLVNALAPQILASLAKKYNAKLIHFSTDYVYDGKKDSPYTESDPPSPLNVYGESKLKGDELIRETCPDHVILRTSWVYGLLGKNFPHTILALGRDRESLEMDDTQRGAPTSVELLSAVTCFIVSGSLYFAKNYQGLFHLTSSGECGWLEFSRFLVGRAIELGMDLKLKPQNIVPRKGPDSSRPARRPLNSRLSLSKFTQCFGLIPPHWTYHAGRFVKDYVALAMKQC